MFRENLSKIIQGNDLSEAEMAQMILAIFSGDVTDSEIGAFMGALATKGETFEELAGAARAMRKKAHRIQTPATTVIDTCGTGGDGAKTFNISTTTSFVVAGCGVIEKGTRHAQTLAACSARRAADENLLVAELA